ncbi:MAG: hypothetical protein HZC36_07485 [Armatimonadetes bacterium]|nr:hypothetical protein [Armatimonadota bacterium]
MNTPNLELEYRPDAGRIVERFEAWWRGEVLDRPPVTLSVVREEPYVLPQKHHATHKDRWWDVEHRIDVAEAIFQQREWVGDSLPVFQPELGPEVLATLFGAELEFGEDTTWSHPISASCRDLIGIAPDFDNPYWTKIRELTDRSLERGRGKWLTGYTDFHSNGDLLAALRDPQELCLEMVDDPGAVRTACDVLTPAFLAAYEDLVQRLIQAGQPTITWLHCPHWGRMLVPNCDFSALISRPMFEEAIWPSVLEEVAHCDRSIFHLDGPSALQHLDLVLECPRVDALQWVWGAGNGPASRWLWVYQKAQAAGKSIQVICEDLDDARAVMKELKPEGVWLTIEESCSREEAERFLGRAGHWH